MRHEEILSSNQRMRMQVRNLTRISAAKKSAIHRAGKAFRKAMPKGNY